jgi:hypothetical protein
MKRISEFIPVLKFVWILVKNWLFNFLLIPRLCGSNRRLKNFAVCHPFSARKYRYECSKISQPILMIGRHCSYPFQKIILLSSLRILFKFMGASRTTPVLKFYSYLILFSCVMILCHYQSILFML